MNIRVTGRRQIYLRAVAFDGVFLDEKAAELRWLNRLGFIRPEGDKWVLTDAGERYKAQHWSQVK